jgi:hypothetical protein
MTISQFTNNLTYWTKLHECTIRRSILPIDIITGTPSPERLAARHTGHFFRQKVLLRQIFSGVSGLLSWSFFQGRRFFGPGLSGLTQYFCPNFANFAIRAQNRDRYCAWQFWMVLDRIGRGSFSDWESQENVIRRPSSKFSSRSRSVRGRFCQICFSKMRFSMYWRGHRDILMECCRPSTMKWQRNIWNLGTTFFWNSQKSRRFSGKRQCPQALAAHVDFWRDLE